MASYVTLINFTAQGETHIQDSTKRAAAFKAGARKMGVKVKEIYWTLGAYDGVLLFEAPDDETAAVALLSLDALGNVRTQTLRAFTAAEMDGILAKVSS
jgi:uncharacterized protein with GYD domain